MKNSSNGLSEQSPKVSETDSTVGQSRREALAKMGLYAAYTAPIMLGMMTSAQAQVASGNTPPPVTGCGDDGQICS